jgi:hypothetical protein
MALCKAEPWKIHFEFWTVFPKAWLLLLGVPRKQGVVACKGEMADVGTAIGDSIALQLPEM